MSERTIGAIASGVVSRPAAALPRQGLPGGNTAPQGGKGSPGEATDARALELDRLVETLNVQSRSIGRAIRFRVDPESTQPIIQVFDRDTGRLIRQIPSDQAAVMASNRETLDLGRVIDVV